MVYENIQYYRAGYLSLYNRWGEERATRLMKDAGLDPAYNASYKSDAWRLRLSLLQEW